MKRPINYRPKYSLSIETLSTIMGKLELKNLIDKYVEAKKAKWKNRIRGK